jgi:DNA-binding NarL/FixJ family response regulator
MARRPDRATIRRMPRSVLVVDDHSGFRDAARALLESAGFEVIGEAHDGESALHAAERLHPAIVLLDVQLPDIDGFAVAEQLARGYKPPAVILTSTREASSYRRRLATSSALGFIAKRELSVEALAALGV